MKAGRGARLGPLSQLLALIRVGFRVAQAEELLAMKVLSMDSRRLQDRIDAVRLLEVNRDLDLRRVRDNLRLIDARGFGRRQDLTAKLEDVLASVRSG